MSVKNDQRKLEHGFCFHNYKNLATKTQRLKISQRNKKLFDSQSFVFLCALEPLWQKHFLF